MSSAEDYLQHCQCPDCVAERERVREPTLYETILETLLTECSACCMDDETDARIAARFVDLAVREFYESPNPRKKATK